MLERAPAPDISPGLVGKTVTRPAQIEPINDAFRVSANDLDCARVIVKARAPPCSSPTAQCASRRRVIAGHPASLIVRSGTAFGAATAVPATPHARSHVMPLFRPGLFAKQNFTMRFIGPLVCTVGTSAVPFPLPLQMHPGFGG
ncbi:HpcH/HpaI aldolase/citrate lyase family protein [Burkholderia stabilis]|uniref:HpcH/HpaI aldolase/citrate lyase family protein n=1 Tax=Burkholderia stabilis TaxID=95485 RepID=UPI0012EA161A|nr:HpcH/HpaI aldolase/citrate lyase family protein [Burkholderia stabilis]HDR9522114.1 HpcH/HpaI aldolase/citrate lyase family protein [Burkholderia stabilis]HDR9529173.1 HpcH/HpaI aldolase/citrate lyase family protein [Burkholderia stabilis]HDR9535414.1 HpcH/HpaI aldolase/citrate lyase family protein [Burkholderia stabilis]HDR9544958.1 HpcH/HpaI aldolase/citrate lyase family protein [Burkholderia stabilis]